MFEERNPKERKISVSLYRWMFFFFFLFWWWCWWWWGWWGEIPYWVPFFIAFPYLWSRATNTFITHLRESLCNATYRVVLLGHSSWEARPSRSGYLRESQKTLNFFFFFFENNVYCITFVRRALSWLSKIKIYQNVRWILPSLSTSLHESFLRP